MLLLYLFIFTTISCILFYIFLLPKYDLFSNPPLMNNTHFINNLPRSSYILDGPITYKADQSSYFNYGQNSDIIIRSGKKNGTVYLQKEIPNGNIIIGKNEESKTKKSFGKILLNNDVVVHNPLYNDKKIHVTKFNQTDDNNYNTQDSSFVFVTDKPLLINKNIVADDIVTKEIQTDPNNSHTLSFKDSKNKIQYTQQNNIQSSTLTHNGTTNIPTIQVEKQILLPPDSSIDKNHLTFAAYTTPLIHAPVANTSIQNNLNLINDLNYNNTIFKPNDLTYEMDEDKNNTMRNFGGIEINTKPTTYSTSLTQLLIPTKFISPSIIHNNTIKNNLVITSNRTSFNNPIQLKLANSSLLDPKKQSSQICFNNITQDKTNNCINANILSDMNETVSTFYLP